MNGQADWFGVELGVGSGPALLDGVVTVCKGSGPFLAIARALATNVLEAGTLLGLDSCCEAFLCSRYPWF